MAADLQERGAKFLSAALDLTTPEVVEGFFAQVSDAHGPTDILVNGAAWRAPSSFLEIPAANWRRTFAVCVDSYFYCSQTAARQMAARKWGRIIHIGSIAGVALMVPFIAYFAAKAAVDGLARAMAVDLAPHGITVNVVAPGVVESQYVRAHLKPEQVQKRVDRIPLGRLATPEEVRAAVVHLASPDMGYVTGQIVYVDGGFLSAGVIAR